MKHCIRNNSRYGVFSFLPDGATECAPRPDGQVLADNWHTDPLNPTVCWRPKTQAEIDAETDAEEAEFNFDGVLVTIAKALLNHENRLRAIEGKQAVTLKQLVRALRQL